MKIKKDENKEKPIESIALIDMRQNLSVADAAKQIRDKLLGGEVDAAKLGVYLKRLNKLTEVLNEDKEVKTVIQDAIEKYMNGTKRAEIFGATITLSPTYTYYDFTECGHPVLDALYSIQKDVKERIESIEAELKLLIPKGNKDITPNPTIAGLELDLGIKKTTKTIVVECVPDIGWLPDGSTAEVCAPRKMQTIGLKFMKV